MQTKFELEKKNFFNKSDSFTLKKRYYIIVDDIYFYTTFNKHRNNLNISIEFFSWSNDDTGKIVPILLSCWASEFDEGKQLNPMIESATPIAIKLLDYFNSFRYYWKFKELFYQFEHPTIIYHYKFLNTFSQEELNRIIKKFNFKKPILNVEYLKSSNTNHHQFTELFLPHYFNGCYFPLDKTYTQGIEISVDLNESDFVTIETDEGKITKDQLINMLNMSRGI